MINECRDNGKYNGIKPIDDYTMEIRKITIIKGMNNKEGSMIIRTVKSDEWIYLRRSSQRLDLSHLAVHPHLTKLDIVRVKSKVRICSLDVTLENIA